MTEDEAKTKWCPAAGARAWDRPVRNEDTRCLASGCMAWRWSVAPVAAEPARQEVKYGVGSERDRIVHIPAVAQVVGDGFCGLASPCAS